MMVPVECWECFKAQNLWFAYLRAGLQVRQVGPPQGGFNQKQVLVKPPASVPQMWAVGTDYMPGCQKAFTCGEGCYHANLSLTC